MMHELLPQIDTQLCPIDDELKFLASTELGAIVQGREEVEPAIDSWSHANRRPQNSLHKDRRFSGGR